MKKDLATSRRGLLKFSAAALAMAPLAACGVATKDSNGVITISTDAISKDAQALSVFTTTIISSAAFMGKLSNTVADQLRAISAKVVEISGTVANASNGVVTLDVGKGWVNSLVDEIQQFVAIAQPLIDQYLPALSNYVALALQMLPFLKATVSLLASAGTPQKEIDLRAKLLAPPMH